MYLSFEMPGLTAVVKTTCCRETASRPPPVEASSPLSPSPPSSPLIVLLRRRHPLSPLSFSSPSSPLDAHAAATGDAGAGEAGRRGRHPARKHNAGHLFAVLSIIRCSAVIPCSSLSPPHLRTSCLTRHVGSVMKRYTAPFCRIVVRLGMMYDDVR